MFDVNNEGKLKIRSIRNALTAVVIAGLFTPAISFSENTLAPVVAHVSLVRTDASGGMFVMFDQPISSCNPAPGRINIPVGHPAFKNILVIATTAFVTGATVVIHPVNCSGTDTLFDSNAYFYLNQ